MKKKVLLFLLLALVVAGSVAVYMFNKPHRDPSTEKADVALSSVEIQAAFAENAEAANSLYIDNVVEISGIVTEVEDTYLILDNLVLANLSEGESSPEMAAEVTIKGRVVGYDDLFEQVRIDFATIE